MWMLTNTWVTNQDPSQSLIPIACHLRPWNKWQSIIRLTNTTNRRRRKPKICDIPKLPIRLNILTYFSSSKFSISHILSNRYDKCKLCLENCFSKAINFNFHLCCSTKCLFHFIQIIGKFDYFLIPFYCF